MKHPVLKLCVLAGLITALAGCASSTTPDKQDMDAQAQQEMNATLKALGENSVLAVNAQRELALSADARIRRESNFRKRFLTDRVSYDFYGDVEQVLNDVANTYEYTFKQVGPKPAGGVLVNVYAKNMTGVDLLRAIAHADTGQRIDVRLTDSEIILYYKEPINTSVKRLTKE